MDAIKVRGVVLGRGMPKICVPIVGRDEKQVLDEGQKAAALGDVVEWRADRFAGAEDWERSERLLRDLRRTVGDTPLLFTYRTRREGGQGGCAPEVYAALTCRAAAAGLADLVDVELFAGEEIVKQAAAAAHAHGAARRVSSHDFSATPLEEELLRRLMAMEALGADLPKVAVTPQNGRDVLRLLGATVRYQEVGRRPAITMSMGRLGGVSRLGGEAFGSCLTFGAGEQASAPGQFPAPLLRQVLERLHETSPSQDK